MIRRTATALSSVLAGLTLAAPLALAGADPTGVWLNDTGRGAIEIKPCGDKLCGHVVWVKDGADAVKGCGRQIIGDAKSVGGGRWDNGWIYSPEKKRNYDVELKPMDDGNLRVTGYAGVKFLSKTMIWKPAPSDLQRCVTTEVKTAPAEAEKPVDAKAAAPVDQTAKVDAPAASTTAEPAQAQKPVDTAAPSGAAQDSTAAAPETTPQSAPQQDAATEAPAPEEGGKGLKIGDLDLDKVLSRTKDGKCKLDLPWVKVNFDCKRTE